MISIVVCTRNRAGKLERMLERFRSMSVPAGLEWEVLVVDNDSSDATTAVVAAAARESGAPVRYLFERRLGPSWARNSGVAAAKGDIVAFTDDDCLVDPSWLARLDHEFGADPELGVVGGRVELNDPADRPVSVRVHRERVVIASLDQVMSLVIGCNLACRRRVFIDVGGFDILLGSGTSIPSAEDWDFAYRALRKGTKLLYSPEVLLFHDHGRRRDAEVDALARQYIIGRWAFYFKHAMEFDGSVARVAARDLRWLLSDVVRLRRSPRVLTPVLAGASAWRRALRSQRARQQERRGRR